MKTYVIYGSPLSGKSTYVYNHLGSNDIVYDYDVIMQSISGLPIHKHNNNLHEYTTDIRDLIITKLKCEKNIDNAWIITTKVTEGLRQSLVGLNAEYIEIKTDIRTAKKRLTDNPDGRDIEEWGEAIDKYFASTKDYSYFYKTREWERKRETILKRDIYQCKECKRYGIVADANTVHHILPVTMRPDLKLNSKNLISLCNEHHEKMHNKFNHELSKLGIELMQRTLRRYPELKTVA